MRELLIVGAGITGSLTASLLTRGRPSLSLTVWEKARGAGGRMSVHRDPANPSLHVDMGAQYVSRFAPHPTDTAAFTTLKKEVYSELLKHGVLQPLSGRIEGERANLAGSVEEAKFVAPKGMNNLAKHFLELSGATVAYQHQLQTISVRDGRVLCETSSGISSSFDGVILTIPVPQLLSLHGNILDNLESETRTSLEAVTYSSRYALGLVLDSGSVLHGSYDWTMKYVDHPIIRFISWDSTKRGISETKSERLLVHTSVPFAVKHLETDKSRVQELIMDALTEVLPNFPWRLATRSHLIHWRFSQVVTPFKDTPGFTELCTSGQPLVLAAGDGFVGSNFENCLLSAQNTVEHVLKQLEL